MKASRKRAARLAARISQWDDLKSDGGSGKSKYVKGYGTFRKPGSEKK